MDLPQFVVRLGMALVLGAIMGLERQLHQRMAGTRTNGLVAAAAAAFTMIGLLDSGVGNVSRIVGQIVSGIGFLGAGVIFKEGMNVHGLNTAATVWCSAAVGALSGLGHWEYALSMSALVIVTNVLLRPLAYRLHPAIRGAETNYHFELTCSSNDEARLRALILSTLDRNHLTLSGLTSEDEGSGARVRISAAIRAATRNDQCLEELVSRVSLEPSVSAVTWRVEAPVVE